jgi:hypothetical protein
VQALVAECLDDLAPGPVRLISICAGDGRNVLGTLRTHARRADVSAWLVELDINSVAVGRKQAAALGLAHHVNFVHADATDFATYQMIAPADIVLLAGVWGHVSLDTRKRLVDSLRSLCRTGGTVIWTRGAAKGPERVHQIRSLFSPQFWSERRFEFTPDKNWVIASCRNVGPARALPICGSVFRFERRAG